MIPLAIAIGIIEDKIANDLTSKDTKARECLEDVKEKLSRHKPKEYKIRMVLADNQMYTECCDNWYVKDGFLIQEKQGQTRITSLTSISNALITDADTEDDYVCETQRGLKDLDE